MQQQVAQTDSDGSSNKAALQTLLHIYQVLYHKEQSAAEKEGRPVKSFEEFAAYVNKNYIYKSPVFAAKVHNNLVSALLETQLMLDARLRKVALRKSTVEIMLTNIVITLKIKPPIILNLFQEVKIV